MIELLQGKINKNNCNLYFSTTNKRATDLDIGRTQMLFKKHIRAGNEYEAVVAKKEDS